MEVEDAIAADKITLASIQEYSFAEQRKIGNIGIAFLVFIAFWLISALIVLMIVVFYTINKKAAASIQMP